MSSYTGGSQESTEDMNERQNQQNCSFCLAFISNTSNASNLKCQDCLRKIDSVPSGFQFKTVIEFKEYECPICLSLIENAIELPCTHLVCKACVEFYENGEIKKHKNKAKFFCSLCKGEYQPNKRKMVGSIDRVIQTSLEVKCLQEECSDWIGCIKDYKHHEKDCKYILIECRHANCKIKVQRQHMDSHVERCPFRPVVCEHCEEMIVYQHLQQHHEQCPNFPVSCPNKDCTSVLKRSEVKTHCENECHFQQINCPYFEIGCSFKGMRGEMNQHSEKSKIHHELHLLTTVKNLKEKSDEGEKKLKEKDSEIKNLKEKSDEGGKKLKEKDIEIENLKELNATKDETLNALRQHFDDLKIQLENVCKQQAEIVPQFEEDIDNLKTFAEKTSNMHFTLSDRLLQTNRNYNSTLLQKEYDKNKEVTKWNEMIKEVVEDDNKCEYLERLKASMNRYKETFYSSTFEGRLENFCYFTPLGIYCNSFIRIGCPQIIKSICVKTFTTYNDFNREIKRKDEIRTCKVRNDYGVCSYYVGDCLHVAVALSCGKV